MPAVRSIEPGDLDAVGASLARAFADDPVSTHLTPWRDDAAWVRELAPFFRIEEAQRSRDAGGWTSDRCEGAATPAHRASPKASDVPRYEPFGFRVTSELEWPMWREPS